MTIGESIGKDRRNLDRLKGVFQGADNYDYYESYISKIKVVAQNLQVNKAIPHTGSSFILGNSLMSTLGTSRLGYTVDAGSSNIRIAEAAIFQTFTDSYDDETSVSGSHLTQFIAGQYLIYDGGSIESTDVGSDIQLATINRIKVNATWSGDLQIYVSSDGLNYVTADNNSFKEITSSTGSGVFYKIESQNPEQSNLITFDSGSSFDSDVFVAVSGSILSSIITLKSDDY